MNLISAIKYVENSLHQTQNCSCGLTAQQRVFGIEVGPSGGPELLVTIYVDDPFFGFWYGHVLHHPFKPQKFVALIVWTDKFINAKRVPLLFQRFHYWIKERLEYHPCAIQNINDAYAECDNLKSAALALGQMIKNFDIDKRTAFEGSDIERSPMEIRVIDIYSFANKPAEELIFPLLPMSTELKLVRNPG